MFAPGVVSTEMNEGCSGWGGDGEFFVFQRRVDDRTIVYVMTRSEAGWSEPEPLSFAEDLQIGDFTMAPDGKTLLFASPAPVEDLGSDGEGGNIWLAEKTVSGWTEPRPLDHSINTKYHESYPCVAANRNLYFFSSRPGGFGQSDLYLSRFDGAAYAPAVNMGGILNGPEQEWDSCVPADESFMVFCSTKAGGLGRDDLYVTFRTPVGSWSPPAHLGDGINSPESENRPYLSPDGKYLFYTSTRRGNRDIYWVAVQLIWDLAPKALR